MCGIVGASPQVSANSWLSAALGYLDYLDLRVFRDRCTRRVAERIIREVASHYQNKRSRPDYRLVVKLAILMASRECNECIDYDKLVKHPPKISSSILSKYEYLKRIYKPLELERAVETCISWVVERLTQRGLFSIEQSSTVKDTALNLLKALVASGKVPSGNPRILAAGLAYLAFKQIGVDIPIDQVASTINKPVESFSISVRSLRKRIGTSSVTA
jgi:hypothetical protein